MINITTTSFGKLSDGREVKLFTLDNGCMKVSLSEYGAALVSILVPDKEGKLADVALGFDAAAGYETQTANMGIVPGRFANRIRKGRFTLNGKDYTLYCNDGNNHLHGGKEGFGKKLWSGCKTAENEVTFSYFSADGEEGYPGNLRVMVTYTLTEDNVLRLTYYAETDKDTVINLTNHCYFDLFGQDSCRAMEQVLTINSGYATGIDEEVVPDGTIMKLEGTPMDFSAPHVIGERIDSDFTPMVYAGGYDHNFILNRTERGQLSFAAELYAPECGRCMQVYTDKPGIQFYSGNFLDGTTIGKGGISYPKRSGICLETQFFPNGMEYTWFPSPVLKALERYRYVTEFRFSVK